MEFDPKDEACWNFGSITRDATTELLMNTRQEVGVFLIRNCTKFPGDLVLCVRDELIVRHYRINTRKRSGGITIYRLGEQDFQSIHEILNYFNKNAIDASSSLRLKRPACLRIQCDEQRQSIDSFDSSRSSIGGTTLPAFTYVTADWVPNAYDQNALKLFEGDEVKVTKILENGKSEVVCNGKFGKFPSHLLEMFNLN